MTILIFCTYHLINIFFYFIYIIMLCICIFSTGKLRFSEVEDQGEAELCCTQIMSHAYLCTVSLSSVKSFLAVTLFVTGIYIGFYRNISSNILHIRNLIQEEDSFLPNCQTNTRNAAEFYRDCERTNVKRHDIDKRLPSVFLIGVAKCGTDTLNSFLHLHPSIANRSVETFYFDKHYDEDLEWYRQQMLPSKEGQVVMDRVVGHINREETLDKLKQYNSSVKLLVILREPVERTLSWYGEYLSLGRAKNKTLLKFEDIVLKPDGEEVNIASGPIKTGRFSESVARCYDRFPKQQIHIIDGDKFAEDPYGELKKVETFLKIDNFYTKDMFIFDKDKGFYCPVLSDGVVLCQDARKGGKHIEISTDLREKMKIYFKPWNQKLRQITGINFSWMNSS